MMMKCKCCESKTIVEEGAYEICDVCFWEDDPVQSADEFFRGGANSVSLKEAQQSYKTYGVSDVRFLKRSEASP